MFCHKCGNEMAEGAGFCHKCGTKVVSETASPTEPVAVPDTPSSSTAASDFKEFVDNHVRTTTKFSSAEDLLNNSKPLRFIWICFGVAALVGLIGGPIGVLVIGGFFGYVAAFIASGIIRMRYSSKFSGKFSGKINIEDLLTFLNENLKHIHPNFHEWGYLEQVGFGLRGTLLTAVANSAKESLKEISLCAEFGPRKKQLSIIYIRPDVLNPNSGEMEYFFGATKNGISWSLTFSRNTCLFKTAPILQAAMEYYLKSNNKK